MTVPAVPDVLQVGPLALPTAPLALILGLALWYSLSLRSAERWKVDSALLEGLLNHLLVGVVAGAKLLEVARSPASFLGSPRLLLSVPKGNLPLLGALVGALLGAAIWATTGARGRGAVLPQALDAMAGPLAAGLAVADLGGGDARALPLFGGFLLAALALEVLRRQTTFAGHTALAAVVLGGLVMVAADFFRPGPTVVAGISLLQFIAALAGVAAYAAARWLEAKQGE